MGETALRHIVVPDVQAKEDQDFTFLSHIGKYIVDKKPDVIVQIGDFADMPSLSSYDVGKKAFEGRRYWKDVEAAQEAMRTLLWPLQNYNGAAYRNKQKLYRPKMVLTLGNHENRITRAINNDPKLDGVLSVDDLGYMEQGWDVIPFLERIVIDGVCYSHYFTTGVAGRPASSAQAQLNKQHMSCIAGHQQGLQIATGYKGDGTLLTSVIAGSCYEHEEEYLGPQGNKHWRGILVLNDVKDGGFDLMPVSLDYLKKRYA